MTLIEHADDVHRLLAELTDEPALMLGCSLGTSIGFHRLDGLTATFTAIARVLGIDPANPDAEPGLTPQPMTPQRMRNFEFFIEKDFTAIINDPLDVAALKNTPTRIVPIAGATTPPTVFDHKCATALATLLGSEVTAFPGGHNGNTTHPRAYATQLRHVLQNA
ncbi:alpha/beta fold hydrolase [Nonomuraea turcica]|uniref:alpha/beta fold hydrolase n=1 Tax=Nonomuraea sp. G32 TaxID=3067274 RepID=UPI00273B4069|nr:hypothetical protein [Nonomuraea sp. G32]MDP4500940.1 hypothetical protein [Nonomuraea sp. G32]